MILSRSSEYAIRLIFYLLEKQPLSELVRIKVAAEELGVPYFQLAKVVNTLKSESVLTSLTGPSGGIDLAHRVESMTLLDIIRIFGDSEVLESCILGLQTCSSDNPCPIHDVWKDVKDEIKEIFANKTLRQLEKDEVLPHILSSS